MPLACFRWKDSNFISALETCQGMSLRYSVIVLVNLMRLFTKKSCYHQGFFAVKRRAVFILREKWKAVFFVFGHALGLSKAGGHEKSVEVHPLRTSTPTKPCNSVIFTALSFKISLFT